MKIRGFISSGTVLQRYESDEICDRISESHNKLTEMKKKFSVAGIGELLWDMLPSGKQLGGAPFNFAYHARQAGTESYIISAIGNDGPGDEIIRMIDRLGVDYQNVQRNDYPTSTVNVTMDRLGHHRFEIVENVAWDHILFDERLITLAKSLDAICFGSLAQRNPGSAHSIQSLVKSVREDCLRVFDINLRQHYFSREIIGKSLEITDILKLNDEELPVVSDYFGLTGDTTDRLRQLISRFRLQCVALTMGSKGSMLITPDDFSVAEAPGVEVADTVGAGDAFTAMLVAGILKKDSLASVHKRANAVAAYICTQKGATPPIPADLLV